MSLKERINIIRGTLTYEQFAEILSKYGVHFSKGNLSKYEKGFVKPSTDFYEAVAKLGYNVNWLLTGKGPKMLKSLNENIDDIINENVDLKLENMLFKKIVSAEFIAEAKRKYKEELIKKK